MHTRTLGRGLRVSAIGLGAMGMSQSYGPNPGDRDAMIAVLRGAVERGVTFFDTAEVYGPYVNEELVGEALAPLRDRGRDRHEVRLADRGWRLGRARQPSRADPPCRRRLAAPAPGRRRSTSSTSTASIRTCRSRTSPAPSASWSRPARCATSDSRRPAAATIRRAHAVHPVTAVQSEYSLWTRDPEPEVLPTCGELGIGFVPFSPLGKGFLTGTVSASTEFAADDVRTTIPRFTAENRAANEALVEQVAAARRGQGCDARAGRPRLAAGPPSVDRAHPRYAPARAGRARTPPPPRCRCPPTRSPTSTSSPSADRRAGGPLRRTPHVDGRPMTAAFPAPGRRAWASLRRH